MKPRTGNFRFRRRLTEADVRVMENISLGGELAIHSIGYSSHDPLSKAALGRKRGKGFHRWSLKWPQPGRRLAFKALVKFRT